jgi:hypothetical protein
MAENKCQFCDAPAKQIWRGEVISYTCGGVAGDQMPRKMECWAFFVMKLQVRIEALEGVVGKYI